MRNCNLAYSARQGDGLIWSWPPLAERISASVAAIATAVIKNIV
jgi:hypothetical protein